MSDHLSSSHKSLNQLAKEYEDNKNYPQALDVYYQLYNQQPTNNFAASGYLRCLRKLNRSAEAVEFGRNLSSALRDSAFVHSAIAWAIYDHYFKASEDDNAEEPLGAENTRRPPHQYEQMQKAAKYVLDRSPATDLLIRTRIAFGICNEAKQRERWQDMYYFATQLNPENLSKESRLYDGRQYMPDYQRWLYKMLKASFELQRYEECLTLAQQACNLFPAEKIFPWWQAQAKCALGQTEEALGELQTLNKRFQEWYIQRNIASIYEQSHSYQEAWIWYCKAALLPGKLHTRYKMFKEMATLLQRIERWQNAYEHLLLARLIAEHENWSKPSETLHIQLAELATQHPEQIHLDNKLSDLQTLSRSLKYLWQKELSATRLRRRGSIKTINERSGFIHTDDGDYYFSLRDVPRHLTINIGTTIEFELEESYDQKKQRDSFKAVNLRVLRHL